MREFFEGMEVIECPLLTESEVVRPHHRFFEWGPEDDWFLFKYGMASVVQVPSQKTYFVDLGALAMFGTMRNRRGIMIHPETWRRVKEHLVEREREWYGLAAARPHGKS